MRVKESHVRRSNYLFKEYGENKVKNLISSRGRGAEFRKEYLWEIKLNPNEIYPHNVGPFEPYTQISSIFLEMLIFSRLAFPFNELL